MQQKTTQVRKMYVCLSGFILGKKRASIMDSDESFYISKPVTCYLLDTAKGWVLFDTGLKSDMDSAMRLQGDLAVMDEHRGLDHQLQILGIGYDDIDIVILSHLHSDHAGNVAKFKHALVYIQQAEYDYGLHHSILPKADENQSEEVKWKKIDGDYKVMDGIEVLKTCGHTPGHQSLIVTLPVNGTFILAADAGDLKENFEKEIPGTKSVCKDDAVHAIRRLKVETRRQNGILFPGHDPLWIEQIKLSPEFYT